LPLCHLQFVYFTVQFINYFSIPFESFVSSVMDKHWKKYTALLVFMLAGLSYSALCQDTPFAVYEGSTACDAYIKQVTGIDVKTHYEKIRWKLFLYQSNNTKKYQASLTYGLQEIGGPGFIGGGKGLQLEGNWTNETGTAYNPTAQVYRLDRGKDQPPILLAKIDESILHFLFRDKKLLIGNAGYGYALNRVKK
jgi:hypothetical protein